MTPLRQRFIEDMQLRNFSPGTIESYVRNVAQFAKHFGRSPEHLTAEHARQYQLHLLRKKLSWSAFNLSVCALRFLYGTTLGRKQRILLTTMYATGMRVGEAARLAVSDIDSQR